MKQAIKTKQKQDLFYVTNMQGKTNRRKNKQNQITTTKKKKKKKKKKDLTTQSHTFVWSR